MIKVRTATPADLERLFQFEQGIIDAERPFDDSIASGKVLYYNIEEFISAPHVEIVVAESDGEVIGCGYARIEKSKPFFRHQRHGYMGFMYVVAEYRGKGVNKMIMDALKSWVKSQGVYELRLQVYNDNLSAIQAYEKIGFKRNMIEMRMSIDD